MADDNYIEWEWQRYLKTMHPEGVSQLQATETLQAFYAGAIVAAQFMQKCGQMQSEEAAIVLLDKFDKELEQFADEKLKEAARRIAAGN